MRDSTRGTYLSPEFIREGRGSGKSAPPGRVLLIVPAFDDTLAPSLVLQGLSQRMDAAHIPVSWYDSGGQEPSHTEARPFLPSRDLRAEQQIRGAILWPSHSTSVEELQSLQREMPLVLIDRRLPGLITDYVGFQDTDGGRRITEHLLHLGHRRIGFASGEPQASTVQARRAGYIEALESAGITPDPSLELHQQGGTSLLTRDKVDAFLMSDGRPLTAVVCANDVVAAHMIQHVRRQRRHVPDDVAITGFGDLAPSMMEAFGITTVAQSFKELGRKAAELLLDRLNDAPASSPVWIELPMKIIVRASCGSGK
jgi:DNA-binding LacI/PurR family transcriptional regulator